MYENRFRTKSLGVELYKVQDSLGIELYYVQDQYTWGKRS